MKLRVITRYGAEAWFDEEDGAEGYARELVAGGVAPRAVVVDHDATSLKEAIDRGTVFDTGAVGEKPEPCPCGWGDACEYERGAR